jgi:putative DNA modification/repair radical SAM protein
MKGIVFEEKFDSMELKEKLELLGAAAKYDVCAASSCTTTATSGVKGLGSLSSAPICHSWTPDGRCVSLFKVLLSNACKNNCRYCASRCTSNVPRASFTPEELAKTFIEFYKRNYVEGLFLSSGIEQSSTYTMQKMIQTVEIVRNQYHYRGYIHLKILPASEPALIERACRLANRVSVNIEAPTRAALRQIAEQKDLENDILKPMALVKTHQDNGLLPSGHTTQFVVGAAGETDAEILKSTFWLYEHRGLRRAYFSAFVDVNDTAPRQARRPNLVREHRLYQSDFLVRQYKFESGEILCMEDGNLDLEMDPKLVLAVRQPERYPVEVNKASYELLLRVPGIGPRSARRIVSLRRDQRFMELKELKNIGVVTKRAKAFITINTKKQGSIEGVLERPKQLALELWPPKSP